jgi:hypothetical protein
MYTRKQITGTVLVEAILAHAVGYHAYSTTNLLYAVTLLLPYI